MTRLLIIAAILIGGVSFAIAPTWADTGQRQPSLPFVQAEHLDSAVPSDGGGGEEFHGLLISAPQPPERLGTWVIETEQNRTVSVIADGQTRFDPPLPAVGNWVRAKGTPQQDGTIKATRIRLDEVEDDELVVRLESSGVISEMINTLVTRHTLTLKSTLLASGRIYLFHVENDEILLDTLKQEIESISGDIVVWVEPNYVGRTPTGNPFRLWNWGGIDPSGYTNQNAFVQINLASAHTLNQGSGQIIAVLDTGVAFTHTELSTHLVSGWDMVTDDNDPREEGPGFAWGHGTHIAGIIAEVAPQSQIMPLRVLDANGRGNTFTLAYAIEWATNHGADVINLSLGTPSNSKVLESAVANAISQGVVIVAAAGNEGLSSLQYPAGYADVISVAAVDSANVKADFSNFGAGWVDIAAPGVGITSTIIGAQGIGYASWSGTSMATGFVSGAAALIHQKSEQMTPADISNQLRSSAKNIDSTNPVYVGQLGGLLNIGAALGVTGNGTATVTPNPTMSTPTPQVTPNITSTPSPMNTTTPTLVTATPSALNKRVYLPVIER